jgi:hypothetical protein
MKIVDLKIGKRVIVRPLDKGGPIILRWGINRHQKGALARVGIQASPTYHISDPMDDTAPAFDPQRFALYPDYAVVLTPCRKLSSLTVRPLRPNKDESVISVEFMPGSYVITLARVEDLPRKRNDPEPALTNAELNSGWTQGKSGGWRDD